MYKKEITKIAKVKGCSETNLVLIQDWIGIKHNLRCEIFYSMFHKKWSVNNYFINTKKGKKVSPLNNVSEMFDDYYDALALAVMEMLNLLKDEKLPTITKGTTDTGPR